MGINFGVSANSLADGTSVVVNENKLATSSATNNGSFLLVNDVVPSLASYSVSIAANGSGGYAAGIGTSAYSSTVGSAFITPKFSGKIFVSYMILLGGDTTGVFQINSMMFYGKGTPVAQGTFYSQADISGSSLTADGFPETGVVLNGNNPWQSAVSGVSILNLDVGTTYWLDCIIGIFGNYTYSNAITIYLYNVMIYWYEI